MTIGDLIKEHRTADGLSQKRLAAILGTTDMTVSRIEAGQSFRLTPKMIKALCKMLSLDELGRVTEDSPQYRRLLTHLGIKSRAVLTAKLKKESDDATIAALLGLKVEDLIRLTQEVNGLRRFMQYWQSLRGTGLEVAGWHMNGQMEPLDDFINSAFEAANTEPALAQDGSQHCPLCGLKNPIVEV